VKVEILESARRDLVDGFYFYEKQADGIGSYFLESMYSDIDSLRDNAGIHPAQGVRPEWHLLKDFYPFVRAIANAR
jgi:hypothetical protein